METDVDSVVTSLNSLVAAIGLHCSVTEVEFNAVTDRLNAVPLGAVEGRYSGNVW